MSSSKKKNYVSAFEVEPDEADGGALVERWPEHLPRPPSAPTTVKETYNPNAPTICVFNVNTPEGSSIVKCLSERKMNVVAVVRNFASPVAKKLLKLPYVKVKVASWMDKESLLKACQGCQKAFFVTKFWEKFESSIEEQIATNILTTAAECGIAQLILTTFENTVELRQRNLKSQLIPDVKGRIFPTFKGMRRIYAKSNECNIKVTNMMTSYYDSDDFKRSLVLIRAPDGKIIVQPHYETADND